MNETLQLLHDGSVDAVKECTITVRFLPWGPIPNFTISQVKTSLQIASAIFTNLSRKRSKLLKDEITKSNTALFIHPQTAIYLLAG